MAAANLLRRDGVEIDYATHGPDDGVPLLLIMGLGMQRTAWPETLIDALVRQGFRCISFDNRDIGLSTRYDEPGVPPLHRVIAARLLRRPYRTPYRLADIADDGMAVLDTLGIERAHVLGMSMGGMIAQAMAARHAPRVASLTSIMSTSGSPRVSMGNPRALRAVLQLPPNPKDLEAVARHLEHVLRTIGSERYPPDEAELKAVCKRVAERGLDPQGSSHQLFAILASGDRRASLKRINAPTLVIHGVDDPLLPVEGSRDIAENIAGAELWEVEGMAHDLPGPLIPALVVRIAAHCRRAPWDQSPAPKPAAGP